MSISSALNNATTGLSAASKRADIVSSNIANALTPGYSKRDLSVSERILGSEGAGVIVNGVVRASDAALTREKRAAEGSVARDGVVSAALTNLNEALGETDDPFSLFTQYQNFETSLRNLSQTPESGSMQAQVLDNAKALVTTFNQLSKKTQTERELADGEIARQVDIVNSALKQIESLNADIAKGNAGQRDVSALLDQRKTLIDQVSSIIPVRELVRDSGAVDLVTSEGVFLIEGTAREVSFTQSSVITADMEYDGGAGALSGVSVDGVDITPGGNGVFALRQGSLAGLFEVRDEIAPDFQAKIDALAADVMQRFEGIDLTLAPGDPGLFTDAGAAYDVSQEVGLAGRIALNAAVDPDQGGEVWRLRDGLGAAAEGAAGASTFINSMLDVLSEQRFISAGAGVTGASTASEAVAAVFSLVGSARVTADSSLASSSARAQAAGDAEAAVMGVDTDQEMQTLLLVERAYAANARVIQTAQAMIDTLMELL